MSKLNYKYKVQKFGIGFQVMAFGYQPGRPIMQHAYAPLTIGYRKGKFTLRLKWSHR